MVHLGADTDTVGYSWIRMSDRYRIGLSIERERERASQSSKSKRKSEPVMQSCSTAVF